MSRAQIFTVPVLAATCVVALAGGAGTAWAGTSGIQFRDAVARVEVIPEARSDVAVTVVQGQRGLPPLRVYREGGRTIVDGQLAHRIRGCGSDSPGLGMIFSGRNGHDAADPGAHDPGHGQANIAGIGRVSSADMPVVTVRVPRDAVIATDGAVFGRIGPTQSLDLSIAGCGGWRVGDIAGPLSVRVAGTSDITGHRAGSLRAELSGSGDLRLDAVDRNADITTSGSADVKLGSTGSAAIRIGGSSDVRITELSGPVHAAISGSGNVTIDGGRSPDVRVAVSGSGDFRFHGTSGMVNAAVSGSGDIQIDHATGPVSQARSGSGDIQIRR